MKILPISSLLNFLKLTSSDDLTKITCKIQKELEKSNSFDIIDKKVTVT